MTNAHVPQSTSVSNSFLDVGDYRRDYQKCSLEKPDTMFKVRYDFSSLLLHKIT